MQEGIAQTYSVKLQSFPHTGDFEPAVLFEEDFLPFSLEEIKLSSAKKAQRKAIRDKSKT